jgi:ABC-type glycerol-3-phosphate transport system substrate-binding protein
MGRYVEMGICDDMTPYFTAEELANISDPVREFCTVDGKFVLFPWYSGPNALIYRSDWLADAGIEPPANLDEMLDAAKKLTTPEHYGFGMIGTNDDSGQTRFVMIMRSFGARELYQENGKWKTEVGSPESIAAFKYFAGLKNEAGVVPPGALENSFNENVNLFAAGQIGMLIAGSNSVGKIFMANPDLKGKIGSVQMPVGKTTFTPISILGWSLNPDSKSKAEAVKFAKFMSSKENAIRWVETTGRMPCSKDAIEASDYLKSDLFKGFFAGTNAMEKVPNVSYYSEVKNVLGKTYQKLIMDPTLDVEKEVNAAERDSENHR